MDDDTEFGDIAQIIDGARYDFQLDSQTLCLRIPQIYPECAGRREYFTEILE